jgi:NADPH2:quinone reductase
MKAIGYRASLPVTDEQSLIDVELPMPVATGRDLLVKVMAVSVNPVDTKVRRNVPPADGELRVLGFDAAGIVEAVGPQVTAFKPGDEVWYAGSRARSGTNAEFHLVDERIVGRKPRTLDFAQAAAMPLTTITAWEALFDRLQLQIGRPANQGTLLITSGAGGVGSIAIQLARRLTAVRIVSTASRPESRAAVEQLGADVVLDHGKPISGTEGRGHPLVREHLQYLAHPPAFSRAGEIGGTAGPHLCDRRSRADRRAPAQGTLRFAALGSDVHALRLRDARHGRARPSAE